MEGSSAYSTNLHQVPVEYPLELGLALMGGPTSGGQCHKAPLCSGLLFTYTAGRLDQSKKFQFLFTKDHAVEQSLGQVAQAGQASVWPAGFHCCPGEGGESIALLQSCSLSLIWGISRHLINAIASWVLGWEAAEVSDTPRKEA